jgi:hypothetical protein
MIIYKAQLKCSTFAELNVAEPHRCDCVTFKALLKYGYSRFKLEILEYCDPSNVIEREQY